MVDPFDHVPLIVLPLVAMIARPLPTTSPSRRSSSGRLSSWQRGEPHEHHDHVLRRHAPAVVVVDAAAPRCSSSAGSVFSAGRSRSRSCCSGRTLDRAAVRRSSERQVGREPPRLLHRPAFALTLFGELPQRARRPCTGCAARSCGPRARTRSPPSGTRRRRRRDGRGRSVGAWPAPRSIRRRARRAPAISAAHVMK